MTGAKWVAGTDPVALLAHLGGRVGYRKRQLFCLAVWGGVTDLLTDRWCREALPVLDICAEDGDWSDPNHPRHEALDEAVTDLDSTLANQFWDRLMAGDSELAAAWANGTEGQLTTWTDADSVRAGAAVVAVAAAEGWVRSLSASGVIGVPPAELAARAKANAGAGRASAKLWRAAQRTHTDLLRDIFGNPFRTVSFDPVWRTGTVLMLARQMSAARDFSAMPILADALQDAGCTNEEVLSHCHDPHQVHVRGCWVVDAVLGKV